MVAVGLELELEDAAGATDAVGDGVVVVMEAVAVAMATCRSFHVAIQEAGGIGMVEGCGATMAGPANRCRTGSKLATERWSADIVRSVPSPFFSEATSPSGVVIIWVAAAAVAAAVVAVAVVVGVLSSGDAVKVAATVVGRVALIRERRGDGGSGLRLLRLWELIFRGDGGGAIKVCLRSGDGRVVRGVIMVRFSESLWCGS